MDFFTSACHLNWDVSCAVLGGVGGDRREAHMGVPFLGARFCGYCCRYCD